jgi:hypothetical protein
LICPVNEIASAESAVLGIILTVKMIPRHQIPGFVQFAEKSVTESYQMCTQITERAILEDDQQRFCEIKSGIILLFSKVVILSIIIV